MFAWKRRKKILIRKVARIATLSLSIDCASFVKYQLYIINAIRYFLGRSFHKNMFLRLCGQFLRMALLENQIEAGTLSKQS